VPSDLTIVVTNYKTPAILLKCLGLLQKYAKDSAVIVVDSDSQDESVAVCKENFPEVKIIEVENHSMGNAANTGMFAAKTKYIMQMNADVFISKNTIGDLLEVLKQPNVAMVGPRAKDKNGNWQKQGILYKRYHYFLDLTNKASVEVSWLHGCCLMIKRDMLEHGGFNTIFRFYNEDIEWSYRLKKLGYSCQLVNTEVIHLGGSSTPNNANFIIEGYRGGFLLSQMYKPKWYQILHKGFVILESEIQSRFFHSKHQKAYKIINKMFKANNFEQSPFGQDLNMLNEDFVFFD